MELLAEKYKDKTLGFIVITGEIVKVDTYFELEELEAKIKAEKETYHHGPYNIISGDVVLWDDIEKALAQAKEEEREKYDKLLKSIMMSDMTPLYDYSPNSVNRDGKKPTNGKRWLTPYELAEQALKEKK